MAKVNSIDIVLLIATVVLLVLGLTVHFENLELIHRYDTELQNVRFLRNPTLTPTGASYIGTKFCDFVLPALDNTQYGLARSNSFLKVLILFSLNDCHSCLNEYRLWSKLHDRFLGKGLEVWAICEGGERDAIMAFVYQRRLRFPVLLDTESSVMKSMGFRTSPLRILVDDMNNIVDVSETLTTIDQQLQYVSMIESRLNLSRREEDGQDRF